MPRYIILNNILTPYRVAFFDALHAAGFDCSVFYMRNTEADRHWKIDPAMLKHPHYIDRGFYWMIGRYHLHINPKLVLKMIRDRRAEYIIAGGWNDVDVLILVILKRLGIVRNRFHIWSEANYMTYGSSRDNLLKRLVRKFVFYASDDALIVPGQMSRITFDRWGIHDRHYIDLPNTIEEDAFTITGADMAARHANALPVFLMPVRLFEQDKGIINYFTALGDDNIRKARFVLPGEGPDRGRIEAFIRKRGLSEHIELPGFCDVGTMVEWYRRANVFLLPSFSDPSPLTLVEALIMRLPVLVSERCGNHWEAVEDGVNGRIFDPFDPEAIRGTFHDMLNRRAQWGAMGARSAARYDTAFRRPVVIERFIAGLRAMTGDATPSPQLHPAT